jgi:hypothetical protein
LTLLAEVRDRLLGVGKLMGEDLTVSDSNDPELIVEVLVLNFKIHDRSPLLILEVEAAENTV